MPHTSPEVEGLIVEQLVALSSVVVVGSVVGGVAREGLYFVSYVFNNSSSNICNAVCLDKASCGELKIIVLSLPCNLGTSMRP